MPGPPDIAARYVEAMNRADIEAMMALFAAGAQLRHITGVFTGHDAIRSFFLEVVFANRARLHRVASGADGGVTWLEVEAESDVTEGRQRVADVFRLDETGRITDLGVYSGNPVPPGGA